MELVYLWVEEYKNIKCQGFNFSPRFECKYENGILDIKDKEETGEPYLKDFFGGNINLTAIVGENGSGKSSILECLAEIFRIEHNKNRNLVADYDHTFDFCLALKIKDKTYEIKSCDSIDTDSFEDTEKIENILDYYVYSNDKLHIEKQILLDNSSIAKMIVHNYSKNKSFKLSSFMYLPNQIEINLCDFRKKFEKLISNDQLYPMSRNESDSVYLSNQSNSINAQMHSFDLIKDKYHQFLILNLLKQSQQEFDGFLSKEDIVSQLSGSNILSEENFNQYFIFSEDFFHYKKKEIDKLTDPEREIYIEKYSDFFEFDFIDDKTRKYSDLSHGEKTFFGQLLNMFYKSQISEIDNCLFLFDEPEIALHPNWQKHYLNEVISLLQKIPKNYHFIFASHSPFLLSDLPKDNVIFLEKYTKKEIEDNNLDHKVDNCKNATKDVDINPFGANIHTLLSHGFFMKDGLMGEFAKGEITKVLNFLNGENKSIDIPISQIKPIIEIIGEDFLREKLVKMYDEKFPVKSKDEEIKELKAEIERLKNA